MSEKIDIEEIFRFYCFDYYNNQSYFKKKILGSLSLKFLNNSFFKFLLLISTVCSFLMQSFEPFYLLILIVFYCFFIENLFSLLVFASTYIILNIFSYDLKGEMLKIGKDDVLKYYSDKKSETLSETDNSKDTFLHERFLNDIFSIAFCDELTGEISYDGILSNYITLDNF